ncbi:unnamed protein product [Haemonchus placei]|uniref:Uncharacterized protein n=1 Tax=Haemonchus placei TaxID=6290 RepID=A0A0N4WEB1_HAEPC|nr:unnamed protein product [Haemonchus placei]
MPRGTPPDLTPYSLVKCNYRRFATNIMDGKSIHSRVDSAANNRFINESTWESVVKPQLQSPSLIAHSTSGVRFQFIAQRICTYSFIVSSENVLRLLYST